MVSFRALHPSLLAFLTRRLDVDTAWKMIRAFDLSLYAVRHVRRFRSSFEAL